mmetsp:Transcript_27340/g.64260  ORF Transcript_27340/g.64260 Transcript_27340/m.64260 type:complete len:178 (-) Transcript_27340:217-750(-)
MAPAREQGSPKLHMRQQVDPKKLELSIARTAFGVSPLRLLDGKGLETGMAALEKNLNQAVREAQELEKVSKHVPSKSMLFERRGAVLQEIRELEHELRSYHMEKVRRRELGMATIGMRLKRERWCMSRGRLCPQSSLEPLTSHAEVLSTKERPSFLQPKLPVLSPSRVRRSMSGTDE